MANVHGHPGDERWPELYYDSSLPGAVLYEADSTLNVSRGLSKDGVDPVKSQTLLAQLAWSLYGQDQPKQKAQHYAYFEQYKAYYGDHSGGVRGSPYFGPNAPVIAHQLRPRGARPLAPANDN